MAQKSVDWKEQAKKVGLTQETIAILEKQKLVFTSKCYEQVYVPYTHGEMPVFITSDSILNTFHVMFEDCLVGNERILARRMVDPLRRLFEDVQKAELELEGLDELCERGKRRALITVGVAIRLLENKPVGAEAEIEKIIEAEANRVIAATGQTKSTWLGKPDDGFSAMDYSQFKPRGFYTKLPILQRYFRTIKWLQSIPFRLGQDEELVALAFLVESTEKNYSAPGTPQGFFRTLRYRHGMNDGPDLLGITASGTSSWKSAKSVSSLRSGAMESFTKIAPARINDLVTLPGSNKNATTQLAARILAASWSKDAELFFRLAQAKSDVAQLPMGIEFAALMDSPFANSWLRDHGSGKSLSVMESMQKDGKTREVGSWFYNYYLTCLQALFEEKDPRLPALFRSRTWHQKSCHTFLASWAQMKHALQLHVKEAMYAGNGAVHPVGFIEPYPEFFSRMSNLAVAASNSFPASGDLDERDMREYFADQCIQLAAAYEQANNLPMDSWLREIKKLDDDARGFDFWTGFFEFYKGDSFDASRMDTKDHVKMLTSKTRAMAAKIASNDITSAMRRTIAANIQKFKQPNWAGFAVLCVRLEGLARKQLSGEPFDREEEGLIRGYGISIADYMGYEGHRYMRPDDDAPRVVTVFTDSARGQKLHVGIGRPREMFLLYPAKGGDVLCRAAVLPYYEFSRSDRLTNQEWMKLLDSPVPPRPPEWTKPLYAPDADKSTMLNRN